MLKPLAGCNRREHSIAWLVRGTEQPCNGAEEGEQHQETEERKVHAVSTAHEVGRGGEPRQQEEHNADEERSCTGKKQALSKTVWHDPPPEHWAARLSLRAWPISSDCRRLQADVSKARERTEAE